jgi:TPP-dependent pyruvate/acetoin dehydrogenase alpha subunit
MNGMDIIAAKQAVKWARKWTVEEFEQAHL